MKKFAFVVLLASLGSFLLLTVNSSEYSTVIRNSYVSGRILDITSPIDGIIKSIAIKKGTYVKKGEVLFVFEQTAIDNQIERLIENIRLSITKEVNSCIDASIAESKYHHSVLKESFSEIQKQRLEKLSMVNVSTKESYQEKELIFKQDTISKEITKRESDLKKYLNRYPILQRSGVKLAINALKDAYYLKSNHTIIAPYDGFIYELNTYPGMPVLSGDKLLVFIPKEELMVEANVLEADLKLISQGSVVDVLFDAGNEQGMLKGRVHSIVPSVAASFSVIPRNNVDSNWIKVYQRVPVMISIDASDAKASNFPIGSSVEIRIPEKGKAQLAAQEPTLNRGEETFVESNWRELFHQQVSKVVSQENAGINSTLAACEISDEA